MNLGSDKIIQPLSTEKTAKWQARYNDYTIVVDPKMTKTEIKKSVERIFGVKVLSVRTANFRKKPSRNRYGVISPKSYKKAILRLPEGSRLEIK